MRIVILGASGHGKVLADLCLQLQYTVVGFLDSNKPVGTKVYQNLSVIGKDFELPDLIHRLDIHALAIAVGDNAVRSQLADKYSPLIWCPSLIHPSATLAKSVTIGKGTVICAGVNIGPDSHIGNFCLLNTHSSLDHDCNMQDFSSLAPGVTVAGSVTIGEASAICLSANISHKVKIGNDVVVGAGSLVLKDVESNLVVYGIPAKIIRERKRGDHYL